MGDRLFWLGKCFRLLVRLGDVAGLWGSNCRLQGELLEDIEVDRSDVLPGPVVIFAIGLYAVAAHGRSLVSDGSRMYSSPAEDRNNTSWPGSSYCSSPMLYTQLKYCFWLCFLDSRKLWTCCMSTWDEGFLGCWKVLLCRISLGEGRLGPMVVEHRSKRSSSSDLPDSHVVLSAVLMVLTCHWMKPLDWEIVEEVMWSMWLCCRNWESLSDMKGGPLSVWIRLGGPYWEMCSCRH